MGLTLVQLVPLGERGCMDTDTPTAEGHMKVSGAATAWCEQMLRGWTRSFPIPSEAAWPAHTFILDFWPPEPQTNKLLSKPLSLWNGVTPLQETGTQVVTPHLCSAAQGFPAVRRLHTLSGLPDGSEHHSSPGRQEVQGPHFTNRSREGSWKAHSRFMAETGLALSLIVSSWLLSPHCVTT